MPKHEWWVEDRSVMLSWPSEEALFFAWHFVVYANGCDPLSAPGSGGGSFPRVRFDERCRESIAGAFAGATRRGRYKVYGCVILPDRAQLLVGHHENPGDVIAGHFFGAARDALRAAGAVAGDHPVWCARCYRREARRNETRSIAVRMPHIASRRGLTPQQYKFVVTVPGHFAPLI